MLMRRETRITTDATEQAVSSGEKVHFVPFCTTSWGRAQPGAARARATQQGIVGSTFCLPIVAGKADGALVDGVWLAL